MTHRTAEESLKHYKDEMGVELGTHFHHCWQELCWISSVWDIHETIFQNIETVKLMNDTNEYVSHAIQKIFFEYVVLGICRLTDPPKSNGKNNLTVKSLQELVKNEFKEEVYLKLSEIDDATISHRDWRNRYISHTDFNLRIASAEPLRGVNRISTTNAISKLNDVLDSIYISYCNSNLILMELGDDDSTSFLFRLLEGRQFNMLNNEARKAGNYTEYRIEFPDWLESMKPGTRYDSKRIKGIMAQSAN